MQMLLTLVQTQAQVEGHATFDLLLQLGAGGILALLIIREVFGFLQKRSISNPGNGSTKAQRQEERLWLYDIRETSARVEKAQSETLRVIGEHHKVLTGVLTDLRDLTLDMRRGRD